MPSKPAVGTDAAKRVARTGAQLALPTLFVQGYNLFAPHPMTSEQTNWIIAVGTLLVGFIQNVLEEQGVISGFLKGPTPAAPPAADDETTRELLALVAANGRHQNDIERLEGELQDIRADIRGRRSESEDPARIETRQLVPNEWPPGGLG